MITKNITDLVRYGVSCGLVDKADIIYTVNRLLELFGIEEYDGEFAPEDFAFVKPEEFPLEEVLKEMLDYAAANGLLQDDTVVYRDLFDTKIMGCMVPRPSDVIYTFRKLYNEKGAKAATDWYYAFSQNTDYIRRYRIKKDMKWKAATEYGEMDITINLSKPEKDPKAIAAAKNAKQSGYPKCQLCIENEGYAGRVNHPARQNHRIIPIEIQGNQWGFQYSPYVYYNEHCIVFNSQHIPMKIEHNTFVKLFSFVEQFPHYFVGSNADLPIVGGSILSHDHFQGGNYEFVAEHVLARDAHHAGVVLDVAHERVLRRDHALGRAGRAGGEDDVQRVELSGPRAAVRQQRCVLRAFEQVLRDEDRAGKVQRLRLVVKRALHDHQIGVERT